MLEKDRIFNFESIDVQYVAHILSTDKHDQELFKLANEIRERYVGKQVYLRGIIEFSN